MNAEVLLDFNLTKAAFTRTVNGIGSRQPIQRRTVLMQLQVDPHVCMWRWHLGEEELKTRQGCADTLTVWKKTNRCLCLPQSDFVMQIKPSEDLFIFFNGARRPTLSKNTPVSKGDDYYQTRALVLLKGCV